MLENDWLLVCAVVSELIGQAVCSTGGECKMHTRRLAGAVSSCDNLNPLSTLKHVEILEMVSGGNTEKVSENRQNSALWNLCQGI